MSEIIKKKKLSELPVASGLDGLVNLGTDGGKNSVQVPLELLKGNKGDTGAAGKDGATPVIGDNGNWWVGGVDSGKPARGEDGNSLTSQVIYNVSQINNKYDYADKQTARNAVPANLRGLGQIITYKLASGQWVTESYQGVVLTGWGTDSNWGEIGGVPSLAITDLTDAQIITYPNIYDNSDIIDGKYLFGATGEERVGPNVSYNTVFVGIKANTVYDTDLNLTLGTAILFYDSSKKLLSSIGSVAGNPKKFTTPANCAYIRYNLYTADKTKAYYIKQSTGGASNAVYFDNLYVKEANIIKDDDSGNGSSYTIDMRNTNTFIGSMNTVIDALLTKKPSAKFVFISHFTSDWRGKNVCRPLIDAQIKLAEYWGADVLVLADKLHLVNRDGINNLAAVVPDSLHPGSDNTGVTVDRIVKLCTSFLYPIFGTDWNGKKIAWYGTSIPYGSPNPTLYAYPPKVADALDATCQNYAVSGSVVRLTLTNGSAVSGRLRFLDTSASTNYISKMVNLIGTTDEPDLFVFDYGINDFDVDNKDFNL